MNYCIWFKHTALWSIMGLVFLAMPSTAQAHFEKEQVMAALIYNFARFVTWPTNSFPAQDTPLIIAVIGDGAMQKELFNLRGKQLEGRTIVVQQLSFTQALEPNSPYHILYIPPSPSRQLFNLLEAVARRPVLTISDIQDFTSKGGMLYLQDTQHTISFSINLDSTEQADLVISSKLFRLANSIIKDGKVKEEP